MMSYDPLGSPMFPQQSGSPLLSSQQSSYPLQPPTKFKVGDRVIAPPRKDNPYNITRDGWTGVVEKVYIRLDGSEWIYVRGNGYNYSMDVDPKYFELYDSKEEEVEDEEEVDILSDSARRLSDQFE